VAALRREARQRSRERLRARKRAEIAGGAALQSPIGGATPWSKQLDRYNLTARPEKFGDYLMTACEKSKAIENRIDVCNQVNAVCRIVMTLKALRAEERRAEPDAGIAGSAVRKYAGEFAARRAAGAGSAAEAASDPFIDDPGWTDPADE
jgi:hypothetical protein